MGHEAIIILKDLHQNSNDVFRWEIMKTLQQIGDSSSIPIFH